jgi:hypothetical protein
LSGVYPKVTLSSFAGRVGREEIFFEYDSELFQIRFLKKKELTDN